MSFLDDLSSNQKFALMMTGILVIAGIFLPYETFRELLGFSKDVMTRDEVWNSIEDYIDQNITDPITGQTGSPYQTEKSTLFGIGVVTISGTDYFYMVSGTSGKLLDFSTTEATVLGWIRTNMTAGGNFYIKNMTDAYGLGYEVDNIPNNYTYGTYVFGQAGEALQFGDLVFLQTDGDYNLADADTAATMYVVGLVAQDIANTGWGLILIDGYARCDSWSVLSVGSSNAVFASTTAGAITQTAPNASGDQVQIIGFPLASKILRFDPDSTTVEIT